MAWQPPNAMSNGAVAAPPEHNGPMGTEYTLQGVMRFLQMQWHAHERERNAWDIERAEMKGKIAKQEGDMRHVKALSEALGRQLKMLERSLKEERKKTAELRKAKDGNAGDEDKGDKVDGPPDGKAGFERIENATNNSSLDVRDDPAKLVIPDKSDTREKTGGFLNKLVEELTFIVTSPGHPPEVLQPQPDGMPGLAVLSNSNSHYPQNHQMALADGYPTSRLMQQNQSMGLALPNNHPPSAPGSDITSMRNAALNVHGSSPMTREGPSSLAHLLAAIPSTEAPLRTAFDPFADTGSFEDDDDEEGITEGFDSSDQSMAPRDEDTATSLSGRPEDGDGWSFDVESSTLQENAPDPAPRRPDTDAFPNATNLPIRGPPRAGGSISHPRKSSEKTHSRRRSEDHEARESMGGAAKSADPQNFKVRFALRGHLDVVRSVIFTGGGSPAEPELCTAGDDGMIKRWIIPATYLGQQGAATDLDISSYFTHRGHEGMVLSLAASPATSFSTGGRASGDGWIFSGGQDATVRVWERGRVDPKATLDGHTDAVWSVCVLPASSGAIFGPQSSQYGGPDRILLASGAADGVVKLWAVSAPPQLTSPQTGSRRGIGGARRHSVTSGSNYPSSPQPSVATTTPFNYTLIHSIAKQNGASPTCISPLSPNGETFVVSYTDASVLIYDTRTGEEISAMASSETYDGSPATGVNTVAATSVAIDGNPDSGRGAGEEGELHGATGTGGAEGVVISGHEDQFIRFFDANSGQCTYSMLAHPAAISSLSLSKDGREAVSAGHDASIRVWSLDKRICTQEITSHRVMRGEGVCAVVWSNDGRLVVSGGGDGVVKVFAR